MDLTTQSGRLTAIREALAIFIAPDQVTELRPIRKPMPGADRGSVFRNGLWRDLDGMARLAAEIDASEESSGIYFVPNPISEGRLEPGKKRGPGQARDADIICRKWLLIDVDPVRHDDQGRDLIGKVSATDAERQSAWEVAESVRATLENVGFTGEVVADSGNGWHLCYPLDLPPEPEVYRQVSELLAGLQERCAGQQAEIDPSVKNLSRVWKLYGTTARKGEPTVERPHRFARIIEGAPPTPEIQQTNNHALQRIVQHWRNQSHQAGQPGHFPRNPFSASNCPDTVERCRRYLAKVAPGIAGQHGSNPCFWAAQVCVHGFLLSDDVSMRLLIEYGATCSPPWSEGELTHKIKSAHEHPPSQHAPGWLRDQDRPRTGSVNGSGEPNFTFGASRNGDTTQTDQQKPQWSFTLDGTVIAEGGRQEIIQNLPQSEDSVLTTRVFDISTMGYLLTRDFPEPNWVIPGILSEGLNILAGSPKQGKSILSLNLALTIAGGGMALGNVRVRSQSVLYLSLEDRHRRVKSRSIKMLHEIQAPPEMMDQIRQNLAVVTDWPRQDESGLRLLELWTERAEEPGLVIIDVWNRFSPLQTGNRSAYDQDADAMSAVKRFADQRGITILVIHHTRKPGLKEPEDFVQEVSGTLGLAGTADGVLVLMRNRSEKLANLHVTGRDVPDHTLVLSFNTDTLTWRSLGTTEQHVQGSVQTAVVNYLRGLGGATAFAKDIADAINENPNSVRQACGRLRGDGIIRKVGNGWAFPGESPIEEEFSQE